MIEAKVILDSANNEGCRLTTLELIYPRFIHAEFMTHRMFSRNASSSRAIPIERMLEQIRKQPAMPIHWGKNQPGMQAREELCASGQDYCSNQWLNASRDAGCWTKRLLDGGLHKQVANRLLEPFQWIKVIVTATEWDNFFKLRYHEDAQPEMMVLAEHMMKVMNNSSPVTLLPGQWHAPYYYGSFTDEKGNPDVETALKLSVARCARVSYLNHDNSTPDIEKDIALADRLLKDGHMSPFEHQATPMHTSKSLYGRHWEEGITHMSRDGEFWSGNFRGFLQNRQMPKGK